jgi:hypothetical protein
VWNTTLHWLDFSLLMNTLLQQVKRIQHLPYFKVIQLIFVSALKQLARLFFVSVSSAIFHTAALEDAREIGSLDRKSARHGWV